MEFVHALDARTWRLVMASTLLVTVTAMVTFLVYPQWDAYSTAKRNYDVLSSALNKGDELGAEINALTEVVEGLSRDLHGSASELPRNQLEAFVIGRMQDICWRHELQLRSIRPGEGARISVFDEILFDVEVSGSYFDIYNWLQDLNEDLGFVVVREFNLKPNSVTDPDADLTASFTMVAYREVPDAA